VSTQSTLRREYPEHAREPDGRARRRKPAAARTMSLRDIMLPHARAGYYAVWQPTWDTMPRGIARTGRARHSSTDAVNKGTDSRRTGTGNRIKGTGNRSKGTGNRSKGTG
jgi:hypothetical protein